MGRPPGHGPGFETRRQEIVDKAAALFAKRGYAGTGIAEIGRAVGLERGGLYHYIDSKESLLVEIQGRVLRPMLRAASLIAVLPAPPLVRLRLLSETLLEMIFRRTDHIWVYEHDYRYLTGDNLAVVLRQRKEFEQIVRSLLEEGMVNGDLRRIDSHLATLEFLNLHNHTYRWLNPSGPYDACTLSREYCEALFFGIGADGTHAKGLEQQLADFRETYRGQPLLEVDDLDDA